MYVQNKKIIDADESKKSSTVKKLLLFALIICLPLVIIMVLFSPMANDNVVQIRLEKYVMPDPLTMEGVDTIIARMKDDNEFSFYFEAIKPDKVESLKENIFKELSGTKEKDELFKTVVRAHKLAESSASLFYSLEFDGDFYINPGNYSEHQRIMAQFMSNEFVVAVIGLVYKATYDPEFVFQWGKESMLAANKFKEVFLNLNVK